MEIVQVTTTNLHVYLNLAQSYEGEFSRLTQKMPDQQGLFTLDTEIKPPVSGFILYVEGVPAGIAAIKCQDLNQYEMCEFYIVPYFRNSSWGAAFAHGIWDAYPGGWEIKQIEGALYASEFWRKTIKKYPHENYSEGAYTDPYWGKVNRQQFNSIK